MAWCRKFHATVTQQSCSGFIVDTTLGQCQSLVWFLNQKISTTAMERSESSAGWKWIEWEPSQQESCVCLCECVSVCVNWRSNKMSNRMKELNSLSFGESQSVRRPLHIMLTARCQSNINRGVLEKIYYWWITHNTSLKWITWLICMPRRHCVMPPALEKNQPSHDFNELLSSADFGMII